MSDYQHRDGHGSLFVNERKTQENHPDYTGSGKVHGQDVRIAGWKKQGTKGPYLSLSFSEPRAMTNQPSGGQARGPALDEFEDDIPFVTNGGDK